MISDTLALQAQQGDRHAQDLIVRDCWDMVHAQARDFYYPGAQHDDIAQTGMLGLLAAIRDYQPVPGGTFRGFASICVHRMMITGLKLHRRQKHELLNDAVSFNRTAALDNDGESYTLEEQLPGGRVPADVVCDQERVRTVLKVVAELPVRERQAIEARIGGLTYRQVEQAHGCTYKSIDNAIQRARFKFIEALAA